MFLKVNQDSVILLKSGKQCKQNSFYKQFNLNRNWLIKYEVFVRGLSLRNRRSGCVCIECVTSYQSLKSGLQLNQSSNSLPSCYHVTIFSCLSPRAEQRLCTAAPSPSDGASPYLNLCKGQIGGLLLYFPQVDVLVALVCM